MRIRKQTILYPGYDIKPNILVHLRKQNQFSQADVAEQLTEMLPDTYVSSQTVSTWERGHRPVPEKYYNALTSLYGVTLEYLCGKTTDPLSTTKDEPVMNARKEDSTIDIDQLHNYDGLPVYVVFKEYQRNNAWGIYDEANNRIVFTSFVLSCTKIIETNIEIYAMKPEYLGTVGRHGSAINFVSALKKKQVYIKMTSPDETIHNLYDGWYTKNEAKDAFINSLGYALPYSGYGISYNGYSD